MKGLKEVSSEEVKKVIKSLNKKKSAISSCIPVKVLTDSVDTYLPIFTDIINSSVRNGTFPEELKLAEVTPLFKKADPFDKVNCRPVSLLLHVSKVYERIIFNQISTYFEPYIWKLWKEALGKGKSVGAVFMDLSKAFDTLNDDLLVTKCEAYGFSENSLNYIQSFTRSFTKNKCE